MHRHRGTSSRYQSHGNRMSLRPLGSSGGNGAVENVEPVGVESSGLTVAKPYANGNESNQGNEPSQVNESNQDNGPNQDSETNQDNDENQGGEPSNDLAVPNPISRTKGPGGEKPVPKSRI
ncbi:Uncharacterized protein CTYZ_00000581 [Cryptosporidium tyzzeri]|nr:Uncharacterized protein CTYZ_00000581 [Cryptosporidium tyzzeri]